MLNKFLQNFKNLPKSNKSMIYLMFIHYIGQIIGGLFINIYIFQIYKDISTVIIYNTVFWVFSFLGFFVLGYMMSVFKKNIKLMYYISYILFILAFVLLVIFKSFISIIFLFGIIYGLGFGSFRCAVHTQELVNVEDKKRDLYSSSIQAGINIINIIIPLIISLIFFLSKKVFYIDGYSILFSLLPILYMVSFVFIKNIKDYIPSKILKEDVQNFFNFKKYKYGLLYIFGVSLYHGIIFFLGAIIAIHFLKNEINVGLYEGIIGIISTIILIYIANKRNNNNRIKIMGTIVFLIFLNCLMFTLNFNIAGYIVYTLIGIILLPLYRVSEHVYDLKIMDTIKLKNSDFYPAMVLREVILVVGRMITLIIMLSITKFFGFSLETILKIGIILIPLFMFITWISFYLHIKYEN